MTKVSQDSIFWADPESLRELGYSSEDIAQARKNQVENTARIKQVLAKGARTDGQIARDILGVRRFRPDSNFTPPASSR